MMFLPVDVNQQDTLQTHYACCISGRMRRSDAAAFLRRQEIDDLLFMQELHGR
jgi:hypothetical protein